MTNPFSQLKDIINAHEKRLKQEKDAKALQEESRKESINDAVLKYGAIAENVLNQLRDSIYPHCRVSKIHASHGWEISHWTEHEERDYGMIISSGYSTVEVAVFLEFDSKNNPANFICIHKGKNMKSKLTQDDLTKTLIKLLHPNA